MFELGQKVVINKQDEGFKFNGLESEIIFISELHSKLMVKTVFQNKEYKIFLSFEDVELVSVA